MGSRAAASCTSSSSRPRPATTIRRSGRARAASSSRSMRRSWDSMPTAARSHRAGRSGSAVTSRPRLGITHVVRPAARHRCSRSGDGTTHQRRRTCQRPLREPDRGRGAGAEAVPLQRGVVLVGVVDERQARRAGEQGAEREQVQVVHDQDRCVTKQAGSAAPDRVGEAQARSQRRPAAAGPRRRHDADDLLRAAVLDRSRACRAAPATPGHDADVEAGLREHARLVLHATIDAVVVVEQHHHQWPALPPARAARSHGRPTAAAERRFQPLRRPAASACIAWSCSRSSSAELATASASAS